MKIASIIMAGGLALSMGAYCPVYAQNSQNGTSATRASDSMNASSSNADSSAEDQNQNQNQNESSAEATNQSNEQSGENTVSSAKLTQMQSRVQHRIQQLDQDLSDAESYKSEAREDWNTGDTQGAQRDFHIAEHILNMASGGGSYQPTILGESPQQQEAMAEKAINQAQGTGVNVSDAKHFLTSGKDALNKGEPTKASRDFRAAELALGVPVQVGYAEVWEVAMPTGNQPQSQYGNSENQPPSQGETHNTSWAKSRELQNNINDAKNRGEDVADARQFLNDGNQALHNGDQDKAQREFRAAERSLNDQNPAQSQSTNQSTSMR